LHAGTYTSIPTRNSVFAWTRGDEIDIAVNLGADDARAPLSGTVLLATERERDGEDVGAAGPALRPGEGLVVRRRR
jgi:hypothetical protein